MQEVFEVQEEIAAKVADQLKISLLGKGPTVEATDTAAYVLVLRARHMVRENTPRSVTRAVDLYREALEIDPGYAEGWSGLAEAYVFSPAYSRANPGSDPGALAREAAEQALALDSTQGLAHAVLGLLASYRNDPAAAAPHYERALALAPGNAFVVGEVAYFLSGLGRSGEAIRLSRYLTERDPVDWLGFAYLSNAYLNAGRAEDAATAARTAIELNPTAIWPHFLLCMADLRMNQPRGALDAIQAEPEPALRLTGQAMAYHALGQTGASDSTLAEMIDDHAEDWTYQIAAVLAERGENDRAFRWLERAADNEDPGLTELLSDDWSFQSLQHDPRWPAFLERIGRSPEQLATVTLDVNLRREPTARG